jgi:dihydrofolate reductase
MTMGKVTCDMAISVDGFVAGPNQGPDAPFGEGVGDSLHRWMFDEPEANAAELTEMTAARAFIMGRNLAMEGGTTFHFVTGGITEALERAQIAAGDWNVAIAGGAATVNQFLAAGLVDELRLHTAPVLLGRGERLFEGIGRTDLRQVDVRRTGLVTHLRYAVVRDGASPTATA